MNSSYNSSDEYLNLCSQLVLDDSDYCPDSLFVRNISDRNEQIRLSMIN